MQDALRSLCVPRALRELRQKKQADALSSNVPTPMAGDLLWAMRQRKNCTQAQTARLVGVTQAQIARWEKSETWPDTQKLHTLCWHLEARPEEIAALTAGWARWTSGPALTEILPDENATEDEWRLCLRRLLYSPPPDALTDLVLIAAERRLHDLTHRHDFAQSLLPTAYAIHARRHLYGERPQIAAHWAKRGLLLSETVRTEVDNQPIWFGSVIADAAYAGQSRRPARLRYAVSLLKKWLPQVEHCAAHHAWGTGILALCLVRLGRIDEASDTSLVACRRAENAKPIERPLRLIDRARLLTEAKHPDEALHALQSCRADLEDNSVYNYVRHRLLEANCFTLLADQKSADERIALAEGKVQTGGGLVLPLEADLRVIAGKMGSTILTTAKVNPN